MFNLIPTGYIPNMSMYIPLSGMEALCLIVGIISIALLLIYFKGE